MTLWFLLVGVASLVVFYAADFLTRRGTGFQPVGPRGPGVPARESWPEWPCHKR